MDELRIYTYPQHVQSSHGGGEQAEKGPRLGIQPYTPASNSECTITEIRDHLDPLLVRPIISKKVTCM